MKMRSGEVAMIIDAMPRGREGGGDRRDVAAEVGELAKMPVDLFVRCVGPTLASMCELGDLTPGDCARIGNMLLEKVGPLLEEGAGGGDGGGGRGRRPSVAERSAAIAAYRAGPGALAAERWAAAASTDQRASRNGKPLGPATMAAMLQVLSHVRNVGESVVAVDVVQGSARQLVHICLRRRDAWPGVVTELHPDRMGRPIVVRRVEAEKDWEREAIDARAAIG